MSKYTSDKIVCLESGCTNRFLPNKKRYGTTYKGHYCPEHDSVDRLPEGYEREE